MQTLDRIAGMPPSPLAARSTGKCCDPQLGTNAHTQSSRHIRRGIPRPKRLRVNGAVVPVPVPGTRVPGYPVP